MPSRPSKIVCIGRNYHAHAAELGNVVPDEPLIFLKPPSSVISDGEAIVVPSGVGEVHFEGEIGVLIGATARHVSEEDAWDVVAGILPLNDVTARDLQRKDSQWTRAKGFDTFCALGSVCSFDPDGFLDLTIVTRVNGVERQRASASQMVFRVPTLIAYISRIMTLEPGDVIATGTPEGIGALEPGDAVEVEIDGVGVLRNPVVGKRTVAPKRSRSFLSLPGYPLAGIPEKRRRLAAAGIDVIDLGAGDADLDPPPAAVAGLGAAAAKREMSRYPFQVGLPAFREAVAGWMEKRFGVRLDPFTEVLPLLGSKEGIANLPLAFLDPGDVAVIPDPGYQAYRGGVILAGGEPHLVPLLPENDFLIPLDGFPEDVRSRIRMLYLNYPNNPTTASAPLDYLRDAVAFCRENDVVLVYDHAYSEIAFNGYRPPSILELDGASEVALEFHSFSKTYNMTGWRLGWAAGGAALIESLSKVKTFVDTGVFKAVQAAGVAALESFDEWVPGNVARFERRRDVAVESLREAGFAVTAPKATMYLWIPVPGGEPSMEFAERALEEQGVVILPGEALGAGGEGFFRVALTVDGERIREAAARLGKLIGADL